MALYGSLANVRAQLPRTAGFDTAFAYFDELFRPGSAVQARVREVSSGDSVRTDLDNGVFIIEQSFDSKLRADAFFESHLKYVDIQVVFEGEEMMEVVDLSRMKVRQPYNEKRDLIIYEDNTDSSALRVHVGEATVFFPTDVHMPSLRIRAEAVPVRKCVAKVPVAS